MIRETTKAKFPTGYRLELEYHISRSQYESQHQMSEGRLCFKQYLMQMICL